MINFYKYEGSGNDFIMINNLGVDISLSSNEIKFLCHRYFGIGADGIIMLEKSDQADCFMNYYNSDGTIAEMCGNGVRCTAKFFLEQQKLNKKELNIDTRAGIKKIICHDDGTFSVNMGTALFKHDDFPEESMDLENIDFNFVSMGNPHAVGFVKDLNQYDIKKIGPKIENDSHFQNKINIELAEKINQNHFKVKVWERGCGVTLACGTGACAVFAILNKQDPKQKKVTLEFPGGKLFLSKDHQDIILRGPANFVFRGEID